MTKIKYFPSFEDKYVNETGDSMTGSLDITTTSNPAFSIDTGGAAITGLEVGDVNDTQEGVLMAKPGLVGEAVPDYILSIIGADRWPEFGMTFDDDDFSIDYEGELSGIGGWVIATSVDSIRLEPGSGVFQVEGRFQIGQPFVNQIGGGGASGFVEWFHDGIDGFITSSIGKIFIPQLDTGGQSLKTLGDSTTELEVRRTVSDLDNTNVTGSGTIQIGGDFTNAANLTYKVEITTGGEIGTAKYRWSDDGGSTWDESNIVTTVSPRNMNNGLKVWFVGAGGTDFNVNDFATITAIGTNNQINTFVVDTTNNRVIIDGAHVPSNRYAFMMG